MQEGTIAAAAERIRDHAIAHSLSRISVIFHGGEPLLVGPEGLDAIATRIRDRLCDVTQVQLGLQTNGTLIDDRFLEVARRHQIRIGLSMDGPPKYHDKFRVDRHGRGTSVVVEKAARLLCENPDVFGGILCVINLETNPIEIFDYFSHFRPKSIDLLLPHATYDNLPPQCESVADVARYGDWLVRFLEIWYTASDERPDVRFFSSIMRLLLGRNSLVESVGLGISTLVVVESNGAIEAVDALKTCYHGAASTGLNVRNHSFDEALKTPALASRQMGFSALGEDCSICPFVNVCGGGYQPHRYSRARGFLNPSIYCETLQLLIRRIASLMKQEFSLINISVPPLAEKLAKTKFEPQTV